METTASLEVIIFCFQPGDNMEITEVKEIC